MDELFRRAETNPNLLTDREIKQYGDRGMISIDSERGRFFSRLSQAQRLLHRSQ